MLSFFAIFRTIFRLVGHRSLVPALLTLVTAPLLLSLNPKTQFEALLEGGVLKVATQNTPGTYFIDRGQAAGFEYELAQAFAEFLGVSLELVFPDDVTGLYDAVSKQQAHLAATGLTLPAYRQQQFSQSPAYSYSVPTLIYRTTQGKKAPTTIDDMQNRKITVVADSSHAELLTKLQEQYPDLQFQQESELTESDLLEQLHLKKLDYTIAESAIFDSQFSFFPGLKKAFALAEPKPISWLLANNLDGSLQKQLKRFFADPATESLIDYLKKKYLQRQNQLNYFDTISFKKGLKERFSLYEQYFHIAEQETNIDWMLLAAIAYQESHWKPDAVSPTGVKGMMMLTNAAAKEVGVTDRTDPIQSIIGGAHYLVSVRNKIPERIPEPDNTWFALAGYNVGFGHLEDARVLTQRANRDPDRWEDVREFLPLLTQKRYYSTVKRGYARGYEPVIYVSNIQKYLELLNFERQLQQMRHERDELAEELSTDQWLSTESANRTLTEILNPPATIPNVDIYPILEKEPTASAASAPEPETKH